MLPMPEFSAMGVIGFMGLALGITVGDALFKAPMAQLEKGISRRG